MRRIVIIGVVIVVALTGMIVLYSYFLPEAKREVRSSLVEPSGLKVVNHGEGYLEETKKGAEIGSVLPNLSLSDVHGKRVELNRMGKRMLLISTSGGPNFGQYAPLLADWASTYRDSLKVVVAFRSLVPTDWKKQLASTGILVIPNTIRLQTVIDPCSMDYSFLIDEHGKITYRFQFEVGRWSELSGTIDQFARKALSPKPVQVSSLKMGARLSLKNGLDAKGNRFRPDQFLGKPTIFFLLKPCTLTNQAVNLLMLNLKERFGNLANIVAIYYLYDFQTEQGVKEYYTRYGMGEVCASEELQNPWKSVDYTKNQGFTVFVDQNGQIMDRSRFRTLPTVLIADRQLNLVDVIGLASNDTPGVEEVEKVIAGVVTGVQ